MDGIHDLGGRDGFGPVIVEPDEPVFHEPWERTARGLIIAVLGRIANPSGGAMRHTIERMDPALYLSTSYYEHWLTASATWNSLLVLWIALLVELRSRQNPRRNWSLVWPIALAVIGLNWLTPIALSLALVYLHPLIGLWILDRELRRNRSPWRRAYHACLACLPLFLGGLWLYLWDAPNLPGTTVR